MDAKTVLTKAIQKAIDGGWNRQYDSNDGYMIWFLDLNGVPYQRPYQEIIFNHDFAKALWGEGNECDYCGYAPGFVHESQCPNIRRVLPRLWQYHLQQMVIADDPIKYLGEHL